MATSPDTFACGVDLGGPSNLPAFVQTAPPDPELEVEPARRCKWVTGGRTTARSSSPIDRLSTHLEAIKNPLLIGQGKDDPRVREADTAAFVAGAQGRSTSP